MNFPVQDAYWIETESFIRRTIGAETPFIAPREFRAVLPRVFPYDFVQGIDVLGDYHSVAVHKGLLHELPLALLQLLRAEWKCVFANEVFLFYMPAGAPPPAAPETHQRVFFQNLESLAKQTEVMPSRDKELTALVVVASHAPFDLDKTLRCLTFLHAPVLVVSAANDAERQKEHASVCSQYHMRFEASSRPVTVPNALKTGVSHWLRAPEISWICCFGDGMRVRPDFLFVMEKFRSKADNSGLSGLWTEGQGIRSSSFRDGFQIIVPRREDSLHCYAHRRYWRQKYPRASGSGESGSRGWRALLWPRRRVPRLIVRDLVTLRTTD